MTGGGPFETAVYPPFASALRWACDRRSNSSIHAWYPPTSRTGLLGKDLRNSFSKIRENSVPGAVGGAPGLGKVVEDES